MSEGARPYRLNSRRFLFTYPRCDTPKQSVYNLYINAQWPEQLKYLLVASEHHADGGLHIHVYVELEKKIDWRDGLDKLAINGFRPNNAGQIRSPRKAVLYAAKDGDYITNDDGWIEALLASSKTLKEIIATSSNKKEFLDAVLESQSYKYGSSFPSYVKCAEYYFQSPPEQYVPDYSSFVIPNELVEWKSEFQKVRPKSLVLYGPSRVGKTQWARSLGRHTYYKNFLDFGSWDESLTYLVLDDIDFTYIKPYCKSLIGGQPSFVANEKYCKKRIIKFGKPTIIIANDHPLNWEGMTDIYYRSYFLSNTCIIQIENNLF